MSPCLDVSISDVLAKLEPVSGLKVPSQLVRLDYLLNVQNHCPQTIKDVTYQIQVNGGCPNPSVFLPSEILGYYNQVFRADPSSVAPGDSAGVKAGQDISMNATCGPLLGTSYISPPSFLTVDIYASGTDATTNSMVISQDKSFLVLGDRSR